MAVTGTLPTDTRRAGEFVRIIREAMTNALLHGQARSIAVTFGTGQQPTLVIADDGQGCPGPIQTGTGLQAMEQRVWALSFHISNMLSKTGHKSLVGLAVEAADKGYAPSRQK